MTPALTLESVQAEFTTWRESKPNSRTPIPDALKRKAVALTHQYPVGKVITALGINHTALKTWRAPQAVKKATKPLHKKTPSFVQLSAQSLPTDTPLGELVFSGQTRDDTHWSLQGKFNREQLHTLLTTLMASQGG